MKSNFDLELLKDIRDPSSQYCAVWKYSVHHSELVIEVKSDVDETPTTKRLFWIFQGVMSYHGPLKWQGADFHLAPDSDCLELIIHLKPGLKNPEVLVNDGLCNLFRFKDRISRLDVHILASGAIRGTELSSAGMN